MRQDMGGFIVLRGALRGEPATHGAPSNEACNQPGVIGHPVEGRIRDERRGRIGTPLGKVALV